MPPLADVNQQKNRLLERIAVFATTSAADLPMLHAVYLSRAARLIDALDIAPNFGAAIEFVYESDDAEHKRPLGMAQLALQAVKWTRGEPSPPTAANAPEWLKKTGLDLVWVLTGVVQN